MLDKSLLPANISKERFLQLLVRYDSLIESISSEKGAKPGQKTLLELDRFRYHDAPALFHFDDLERSMKFDDVKTLVDWKLRHGKFRPTLTALVSSNDEGLVESIIQEAVEQYQIDSDAIKANHTIKELRGIGPATASLLLSIYDPHRVIFFSDEAFYWLCCDGQKSRIKYNVKEYQELTAATQTLFKRLGVNAVDVEKVAYVLMKEGDSEITPVDGKTASTSDTNPAQVDSTKKSTKRKDTISADDADSNAPVRRSKRGKA
ncbi:uncharacterized protein F4822DRAFT_426082 [Hypoxylon trugodes]|uniref:uncharacterized protein n=1 Tax=Hypoxylon trugodes TaxID=326681 RepID=UPI00219E39D4|nr:uncharacterized protein F4822DRAFT_426082 [Hypoxylon trugodes]KAI1392879.1 hypothetical protein F4822DRAFT_426082 [Hypoxylon trugodes]